MTRCRSPEYDTSQCQQMTIKSTFIAVHIVKVSRISLETENRPICQGQSMYNLKSSCKNIQIIKFEIASKRMK